MQILTGGGEAAGVEEVGEAVDGVVEAGEAVDGVAEAGEAVDVVVEAGDEKEVAGVGAVECRLPTSTFYFSI